MSERLHDDQLDREIRQFLDWHAQDVSTAPSASEMAARLTSAPAARRPALGTVPQLAPRLVWVALAALLMAALVGGALIAGWASEPARGALSYEAVFLRLEVVEAETIVTVVGVNPAGKERRLAQLPGAWAAYAIRSLGGQHLSPMGAVSPGGLIAIPSDRGSTDLMMHWEVFDLSRPNPQPLALPGMAQFIESLRHTPYFRVDPRGGAFWGPGEQLAIVWYVSPGDVVSQLSYFDARTSTTTPVAIPEGLFVQPYWAIDGSGVFVSASPTVLDPPGGSMPQVLRSDGSVAVMPEPLAQHGCGMHDPAVFLCIAPDGSMSVLPSEVATERADTMTALGSGDSFVIQGSFAGWMEVAP